MALAIEVFRLTDLFRWPSRLEAGDWSVWVGTRGSLAPLQEFPSHGPTAVLQDTTAQQP